MKWLKALSFYCLFLIQGIAFAQHSNLQDQYQQHPVQEHSFNQDTWKKSTEGLDYSDKRKKPPPKKEEKVSKEQQTSSPVSVSEETLRLIAFVLLFAILIFILLKAFGVNIFLGKKKAKDNTSFSLDQFDDHIPESELDRFLREALQQKDFRLAVRIYYLMVIKELSERKLISWRKEKTNFDYLVELQKKDSYGGFRKVTLIFERIWYGERAVDENSFGEVSTQFRNFLSSLKKPL